MSKSHILGFPRIGATRQMKQAAEAYWSGNLSLNELEIVGQQIQNDNWAIQAKAGLDFVTVGDFTWYDHVLDLSALLGVVPERFGKISGKIDLNTIFCMARGQAPQTTETTACEMTKWFNTNYHYIVPEFHDDQQFKLSTDTLFADIHRAQNQKYRVKPVLVGPLTYLWLGKTKGNSFNKLSLLPKLIAAYNEILDKLAAAKVEWLQLDEPILTLDLSKEWQTAFLEGYQQLNFKNVRCLLTTYFGPLNENLSIANQLPVHGLHIDLCSAPEQLSEVIANFPKNKVLSLGVINGRNIWRADLKKSLETLKQAKDTLGDQLWIGSSCSLLHTPVDLENETELDQELKSWLSFAKQKVDEIALLKNILTEGDKKYETQLTENQEIVLSLSR